MTDMTDLLRRAAEPGPVGFTVVDVRRRVRQRRRTRRGLQAAAVAVVVAVGTTTLALDDVQRIDSADLVDAPVLEQRWTALYSNAVGIASAGAYLELRDDGTLAGSDGCNRFQGRFAVDDDRIVVDNLAVTEGVCGGVDAVAIVEILDRDPRVSSVGGGVGTLRLGAPDVGFVAFEATGAGPEEGIVETEVAVPGPAGGRVSMLFRTPRTVTVGTDRQILRWYGRNDSGERATVWADYAIEGLPASCPLGEFHRWEDLEPELRVATRGELFPQHNLEPGATSGFTARREVSDRCRGDYVLVLLATNDPVGGGEVVERRVPFTIR